MKRGLVKSLAWSAAAAVLCTCAAARSAHAAPEAVPRKTVHHTFANPKGLEILKPSSGLIGRVENGEFRISGKMTSASGNDAGGFSVPVKDEGGAVEVEGTFRLLKYSGHGLVYLEAVTEKAGRIILTYEWHANGDYYRALLKFVNGPSQLEDGRRDLQLDGSEEEEYSTVRLFVHEGRRRVSFFAGDRLIDSAWFGTDIGAIKSVRMCFQTDENATEHDIRFGDLIIRWL